MGTGSVEKATAIEQLRFIYVFGNVILGLVPCDHEMLTRHLVHAVSLCTFVTPNRNNLHVIRLVTSGCFVTPLSLLGHAFVTLPSRLSHSTLTPQSCLHQASDTRLTFTLQ